MPGWLTETVIVQAITTLGIVLGALITVGLPLRKKLTVIGKDAQEAREQVKNSHTTNLREEGDERHAEITESLTELTRDVRGLRDDHEATRRDIGVVHGAIRGVRQDVQGLREADEQGRQELQAAVSERHREINRLRSEIPIIIRREITNNQD